MVRLEIGFITGPSCAASVNRPRARAVDAHRSIFTVWTLQCKHTYYCSLVCSYQHRTARSVRVEAPPRAGPRLRRGIVPSTGFLE